MVDGNVIYKVLCDQSVQDRAEKLVELANAGGGLDNIAVVVVDPYGQDMQEDMSDVPEATATQQQTDAVQTETAAGDEAAADEENTAEANADQAQPETGRN